MKYMTAREALVTSENAIGQSLVDETMGVLMDTVRVYAERGLRSMRVTNFGEVYGLQKPVPHFETTGRLCAEELRDLGYRVNYAENRVNQMVEEMLIQW